MTKLKNYPQFGLTFPETFFLHSECASYSTNQRRLRKRLFNQRKYWLVILRITLILYVNLCNILEYIGMKRKTYLPVEVSAYESCLSKKYVQCITLPLIDSLYIIKTIFLQNICERHCCSFFNQLMLIL